MDNVQVIENLKQLLVEHTSNTEIQIADNLTMIFQSFQNKSLKEDIDSYAEFVLLGASLFESWKHDLLFMPLGTGRVGYLVNKSEHVDKIITSWISGEDRMVQHIQ